MKKVVKKFKSREKLNEFISQNTLKNPNISFGGLTVEHYVEDGTEEDTTGCVGCKAGFPKGIEAVKAAATKLSNKK